MPFLFELFVLVLVLALIWWAIQILPIEPKFKNMLLVILVVLLIIWIVQGAGLFGAPHRLFR